MNDRLLKRIWFFKKENCKFAALTATARRLANAHEVPRLKNPGGFFFFRLLPLASALVAILVFQIIHSLSVAR